jgi:CelD/BcsL family acetyltransferase involved in cellulose biosynthesis
VNIRCIERFEELCRYRTEWNQLLQQSPTNTIFQTFEWLESWWEVFGEAYRLQVLLGFADDTLVAAAPLVLSKKRHYARHVTCLEFMGGMPSDYLDFLARGRVSLHGLVNTLHSAVTWDLLNLDRIPADSPTLTVLAEEFPGWRGTQFFCDSCSAYVFGPGQDGSEVLGKKSIRRHVSGLHKAGTVAVRHLTQAELITPELDVFFDQHVTRRAQTAEPSHFVDPHYRTFYRLLTERLAPRGWVLFTVVTLDSQPVAFHYGFVYGRRLLWYKPTFSVAHARLSPGEVLIAELFQYCRAQGLRELDFSIGEESFKNRFSNVKRHNLQFRAFRHSLLQQVNYADRALREGAKRLRQQLHAHSSL